MQIDHCDFNFPVVGGGFSQAPTKISIMRGIQVDNKDCEISIHTEVGVVGYRIMTEFVPNRGAIGYRTYKNGNKLPKKYQQYVPILIEEHLKRFPEIKIEGGN
jgi:hypothetical protein